MFQKIRAHYIQSRLGRSGHYVHANGADFYYERYGSGEPVMMFHGGLSTLETFRFQIPELSKDFQLILPERRGHGHTRDTTGPYSYRQMADDMAGVMRAFGYQKMKIIGYSDGANLLLPLALHFPELVERLVLIGGNFHHNGCICEHQESLRNIPEGAISSEGVDERYARYSPDGPSHYAVVFNKIKKVWLSEPSYPASELKKIQIPVLLMAGDKDIIQPEHTMEFYQALPMAELCILPAATHRVIKEKPGLVNRILLDFLKKPADSFFKEELRCF